MRCKKKKKNSSLRSRRQVVWNRMSVWGQFGSFELCTMADALLLLQYLQSGYQVQTVWVRFWNLRGGKQEKNKMHLIPYFRHYLFELKQEERNELRLAVELKWKENKNPKTWNYTFLPLCFGICFMVLIDVRSGRVSFSLLLLRDVF